MSVVYQERFSRIEAVLLLEKEKIDIDELRASCSYGVPDLLRPLVWRLLLDYLPAERASWKAHLKAQRENYDTLVEQLIVTPSQQHQQGDHPLSDDAESNWGAFFADNTTLSQINKDVRRLCPEIQFFQLNTCFPHRSAAYANLSARVTATDLETRDYHIHRMGEARLKSSIKKRAPDAYSKPPEPGSEAHWQVAERILFIYSKLNPGVKYVQGMNEVLGPLYYVFASDPDTEWAEHAEADCFYCFQHVMSEIKDNFIKSLDDSCCGIEQSMASFHSLLEHFDPLLYTHLVRSLSIRPQYYAFRWLSLMLSQEMPLPDVITLWDALFSDPKRFTLLPYVCLAMLEREREQLLNGDFSDCLRLLQNYPDADAQQLVMSAYGIREGRIRPVSVVEEAGGKSKSTLKSPTAISPTQEQSPRSGKANISDKIADKLRQMNFIRK